MAATKTLIQPDFFGKAVAYGRVVGPAPPPPTRRKVHETQRDAHRAILPKAEGMDARVLAALAAAGLQGLTRQELHDATDIKLQTVCGCVDRLLKASQAFEPVIGFEDTSRALHLKRGGAKVVVHVSFQHSIDWRAAQPVRTTAA